MESNPRSCLNRAYYAAFSKVNHALVGTPGVTIKLGRQGVNHPGESGAGGIRRWIVTHMPDMEPPKRPFQIQILAGSMPPVRSLMGPEMPAYMVDRAGRRQ